MGHPAIVMQRVGASLKYDRAPLPLLHSREPRVGNPFARIRKFSGKTVLIHCQMRRKKGRLSAPFWLSYPPYWRQILAKQLALRELERLARLGAAVLFALDHARVTGEEAALFQQASQIRLEISQRLRDAVTHRTCLARQTAAGDRANDVVLAGASGCDQRLLDHHPQHRTGEIDFDFAGVDDDLAGTGLDPDAGDRVLALAGGIGTALLVDLLDVFRRFRRGRLELRQLIERLHGVGHFMRPSCSCDSSKRYRASAVAGPRADARARDKRLSYRAAPGRAARAESCARWPSRPRARENGPRGSTLRCVP